MNLPEHDRLENLKCRGGPMPIQPYQNGYLVGAKQSKVNSLSSYSDAELYWEKRLSDRFDLTGAGYSSIGPDYNAHLYRARLRALERALSHIDRSINGARILEIGCGTGFYTEYCARKGVEEYIGLDITSVSVDNLRGEYPQFTFIQGDATKRVAELQTKFDVVLAADVLFHIVENESFLAAMRNIAGWLQSGGLLILSDILPPRPLHPAPHCFHRSLGIYERVLAENGLNIAWIEPIFAILHPPALVHEASLAWRAYALAWKYGWRLAKLNALDHFLPRILGWLDERYFLSRYGLMAPNSKWLIAVKD